MKYKKERILCNDDEFMITLSVPWPMIPLHNISQEFLPFVDCQWQIFISISLRVALNFLFYSWSRTEMKNIVFIASYSLEENFL